MRNATVVAIAIGVMVITVITVWVYAITMSVEDNSYKNEASETLYLPLTESNGIQEAFDVSLIWSLETTRKDYYNIIAAYKQGVTINYEYYLAIEKYSDKYNLSAATVSALIAKECSFDINATHAIVTVKTRSGKVTTRAIGAGVIYEMWAKELKDVKINSKDDLRSIENNVKATCYILKILRDRRQVRGAVSLEQSMVLRYYGIIRRDGVVDKAYYDAIMGIRNRYLS